MLLKTASPLKLSCQFRKNKVLVTLKDDGEGIPEEHLPNIFKPFYRVDSSRSKQTGGHGLGLNLCEKIIEAHKGSITIQNNTERGVIVSIRLGTSFGQSDSVNTQLAN